MIRQCRRSAICPMASVSRPSSKACRNRSQIIGWDFSNSSSSSTENGCLRTRLISEFASNADALLCPRILLDRFVGLKLAHVEPDHALGRAEQKFR